MLTSLQMVALHMAPSFVTPFLGPRCQNQSFSSTCPTRSTTAFHLQLRSHSRNRALKQDRFSLRPRFPPHFSIGTSQFRPQVSSFSGSIIVQTKEAQIRELQSCLNHSDDAHCDASETGSNTVLQVLKHRFVSKSKPGQRHDDHRVALCIEGGGMRGAISAGMTAAIEHLGLSDAFDVVYGCSAGSIVGAYFVSRQLPIYGARIYYDLLCAPHRHGPFIDVRALRHHPYLRRLSKLFLLSKDRPGKVVRTNTKKSRPVLWLDRLIWNVMTERAPLDWQRFWKNHTVQPLVPVAASLEHQQPHAFWDVETLDGLLLRLRASASVAGIAGDLVEVDGKVYADALMYEPIPVDCAINDGATHIVVLRTRRGCKDVPKRVGVYEWLVAPPCIREAVADVEQAAQVVKFLRDGRHIAAYRDTVRKIEDMPMHSVLSVEPGEDTVNVKQLETDARVVFDGVRAGFVAGVDALVDAVSDGHDGEQRLSGVDAVSEVFPNSEIESIIWKHKALRTRHRLVRRRGKRIYRLRAKYDDQ